MICCISCAVKQKLTFVICLKVIRNNKSYQNAVDADNQTAIKAFTTKVIISHQAGFSKNWKLSGNSEAEPQTCEFLKAFPLKYRETTFVIWSLLEEHLGINSWATEELSDKSYVTGDGNRVKQESIILAMLILPLFAFTPCATNKAVDTSQRTCSCVPRTPHPQSVTVSQNHGCSWLEKSSKIITSSPNPSPPHRMLFVFK